MYLAIGSVARGIYFSFLLILRFVASFYGVANLANPRHWTLQEFGSNQIWMAYRVRIMYHHTAGMGAENGAGGSCPSKEEQQQG